VGVGNDYGHSRHESMPGPRVCLGEQHADDHADEDEKEEVRDSHA